MTRLEWGNPLSNVYETGIDRGVLFVGAAYSAWNGLIAITEGKAGGESTATYIDGEKIHNGISPEEFIANLSAYAYPDLFGQCDGVGSLGGGLYIDSQPRRPFNLTYRTMLGDGVKGLKRGYKLHFIYNAHTTPSQRSYKSKGSSIEPTTHAWGITTKPIKINGHRASSHLIVDSTKVAPAKLETIENYIYGSSQTNPLWPTPQQLMTMLS